MSDDPTPVTGQQLGGVDRVLARADAALERASSARVPVVDERTAHLVARVDAIERELLALREEILAARGLDRARVTRLEERVAALETKLDQVLAGLRGVAQVLDHVDKRLGKVEARILGVGLAGLLVVEILFAILNHYTR